MATTNHAGFSPRSGAALPTDLGHAIAKQLGRFFDRFAAVPAATNESFSGPRFEQLSPGLAIENGRR